MLVKDRPKLTRQSLQSLAANTKGDWNLTIVNDGSQEETLHIINQFQALHALKVSVVRFWGPRDGSKSNLGKAKNFGVKESQMFFGRGEHLYISDNDVYFMPTWHEKLTRSLDHKNGGTANGFKLIGGQNHPYHQKLTSWFSTAGELREYGALAGTSWLMSWPTWDEFGPICETGAGGVGQSEDHEFCQRIRAAGYRVGAVDPPVVIDTGITQTGGELSVGHDVKVRVPGVIYG